MDSRRSLKKCCCYCCPPLLSLYHSSPFQEVTASNWSLLTALSQRTNSSTLAVGCRYNALTSNPSKSIGPKKSNDPNSVQKETKHKSLERYFKFKFSIVKISVAISFLPQDVQYSLLVCCFRHSPSFVDNNSTLRHRP